MSDTDPVGSTDIEAIVARGRGVGKTTGGDNADRASVGRSIRILGYVSQKGEFRVLGDVLVGGSIGSSTDSGDKANTGSCSELGPGIHGLLRRAVGSTMLSHQGGGIFNGEKGQSIAPRARLL